MMLSGPLSILMGASGIASDSLFAVSRYAYRFDLTAWGWIHILVGLALVIAGLGVVTNKTWGRGAGAAAAGVSLITQFMFVPYYPLWAIPVMTLDLLIIFALTRFHAGGDGGGDLGRPAAVHGRRLSPPSVLSTVTVGSQRNSPGTGQISNGSSGRSAQLHQTCLSAHLHSDRQVRRPSSLRSESTRPPDSMGRQHSGQAGASLGMGRTLTSHGWTRTWSGPWPVPWQ